MEAGSLLQEALSRQAEYDFLDSDQALLLLDVYLLKERQDNGGTQNLLLALAELATELNQYVQSQKNIYQWHMGGDGPVFGIHISQKIPHLRAMCRYGANVADEWMAVHYLLQFTSTSTKNMAAEVWDVQDGQLLLIESADLLPNWVDQIGPEACRHRCWIQQGKIRLIAPKMVQQAEKSLELSNQYSLNLSEALKLLGNPATLEWPDNNSVVITPESVQQAIQNCIGRLAMPEQKEHEKDKCRLPRSSHYHKAALSVPRSVAHLIQQRPDLVNAAIVAFAALAQDQHPKLPKSKKKVQENNKKAEENSNNHDIVCEDWVWTTHSFSKTNYAMLRTIVSPTWKVEDYIPPKYKSVELRRIQRQCNVEATPHLRHAVQLGVRLVAGFEALLKQAAQQQPSSAASTASLKEQRIIQGWSRISQELQMSPQWLIEAWQAGPNNAPFNLEPVLNCPVYYEEMELNPQNITLLSYPEMSLKQQITKELKREGDGKFVMPRQEEVDTNEDWMVLSMEHVDEQMQSLRGQENSSKEERAKESNNKGKGEDQTAQLDTILDGFKTFMVDKSDVQGVTHNYDSSQKKETGSTPRIDIDAGVSINPRIFLNLLQTVLDPTTTPESISFPTVPQTDDDKYFSKEDYEDMLASDEDENNDDGEEGNQLDTDVVELMNAMDQELKGSAALQKDDVNILDAGDDSVTQEHANVLANLLQSLDAGSGGPGPVQSMMKAMGQEPPLLSSDAALANEEESSDDEE